jgi:hypothetical protein
MLFFCQKCLLHPPPWARFKKKLLTRYVDREHILIYSNDLRNSYRGEEGG